MPPILVYHQGTLLIREWDRAEPPPRFTLDPRTRTWRAPAMRYALIISSFKRLGISIQDRASRIESVEFKTESTVKLRPYQRQALDQWESHGRRGTVVLPTGAGKTEVAISALRRCRTSALVMCPTLDLMNQWFDRLADALGVEIGVLGGGRHEILLVTVTTYDSAYRHIDRYGDRFGLIVFDEAHHLPAPSYLQIPELAIAPYRLGLTATYRRADAAHLKLAERIGPVVFEKKIRDLKGGHLADFDVRRIPVDLEPDEKGLYDAQLSVYNRYVKEKGVRFFGGKWDDFIQESGRDPKARSAVLARMELRRLTSGAREKLRTLESLLIRHGEDRVLIFTLDNALVYAISRQYLVPAITHETDVKERKDILDRFRKGEYRFLATSKVLNEGVDVPAANVAIVLGGSASPVEHIQRLGRILRKKDGKRALLYEVVVKGTQEGNVSYRRRNSDAYRGSGPVPD
jgi:superfamily II DNA or RNA helicase